MSTPNVRSKVFTPSSNQLDIWEGLRSLLVELGSVEAVGMAGLRVRKAFRPANGIPSSEPLEESSSDASVDVSLVGLDDTIVLFKGVASSAMCSQGTLSEGADLGSKRVRALSFRVPPPNLFNLESMQILPLPRVVCKFD